MGPILSSSVISGPILSSSVISGPILSSSGISGSYTQLNCDKWVLIETLEEFETFYLPLHKYAFTFSQKMECVKRF